MSIFITRKEGIASVEPCLLKHQCMYITIYPSVCKTSWFL